MKATRKPNIWEKVCVQQKLLILLLDTLPAQYLDSTFIERVSQNYMIFDRKTSKRANTNRKTFV